MIQTKNRGKYRILPGNPEKMGASATKDGYNFAVEVSDGKKAELLLYRKGHQKPFLTVPLPEEERTGVISSVEITGRLRKGGPLKKLIGRHQLYCIDTEFF